MNGKVSVWCVNQERNGIQDNQPYAKAEFLLINLHVSNIISDVSEGVRNFDSSYMATHRLQYCC